METPYGVAQVFYDSHQVSRDEVLERVGAPCSAILLKDRDPRRREQILLQYAETYVLLRFV